MRLGLLLLLTLPGCAYHIGSGLTEGAFDELRGGSGQQLLERQLVTQLGQQLGKGFTGGALDADEQARMQRTVEMLLDVAAKKTGKGLREEVSPELREMVQRDIVRTFAEGVRGDIGDSMEELVDRVVRQAMGSLDSSLQDDALRASLSGLLRDSVYYALQEDQATLSVGSTLEDTLNRRLLTPVEDSVGGLTELVADRIDQSARRTENTLRAVIGALVVLASAIGMLYYIRNRQVRRLEEQNTVAERGLRNIDAALALLDPEARSSVLAKLEEYQAVEAREVRYPRATNGPAQVVPRSDDYQRRQDGPS